MPGAACRGAAGGPAPSRGERHLGVVHRGALRKGQRTWDDRFSERTWGLTMPRVICDLALGQRCWNCLDSPGWIRLVWLLYFSPTQLSSNSRLGGSGR